MIPAPAAGADWSFLFPAGHMYRVLMIFATLQASAVVASRFPILRLQDGDGNVRAEILTTTGQTANLKGRYTWIGGPTTLIASGDEFAQIAMPDLLFDAGWSLQMFTLGKDPGDQWSTIRMLIEELVDDAPMTAAGHDPARHAHIDLEVHRAP